jgi:hypothetical protein
VAAAAAPATTRFLQAPFLQVLTSMGA